MLSACAAVNRVGSVLAASCPQPASSRSTKKIQSFFIYHTPLQECPDDLTGALPRGEPTGIQAQIVADIPLLQIAKKRIKPTRRLKAWEIVLLAVGSPVWASLLIAALAVLIALYASFWAIIASLWAAFGSLAGCALGSVVSGLALSMGANLPAGMALIGAGIVCAGLSVLLFFACKAATKGLVVLASKTVLAVKRCLIKKEGVA